MTDSKFRSCVSRLHRYRGMAVLLLWQAPSPVHVLRDDNSRLHLSFGAARGVYEDITPIPGIGCEGEPTTTHEGHEAKYREKGVAVEVWPSDQMRASVSYGRLTSDSAAWRGAFGAIQVAYEGPRLGLGAGYGSMGSEAPDGENHSQLSGYARVGRADGWHGRFDTYAPQATLGATGQTRLGVGYNLGNRRGAAGFAGLATCHFCQGSMTNNTSLFIDARIPTIRQFDVTASILFGGGLDYGNWAVGVGGRVNLW